MADPQVTIDPSMAHHFRLEAWDDLDDGGKLALSDYLSERLQNHGWEVPEPMVLRQFGPPDELRSVLQWLERTSGMTFSFIPGGSFRPGYDEAQLARLEELRQLAGDDESEAELDSLGPGQTLVFGSESTLDLRIKPPVEIPPFFMATEPVRPRLPVLRSVVELPDPFFEEKKPGRYDFMGDAIHLSWEQLEPVLEHYGWSLPTSGEFEWALRGGVNSLFYWGDELPEFMTSAAPVPSGWPLDERQAALVDQWRAELEARRKASFDAIMSAWLAPERPQAWPWCNRFGLAAMLPLLTWCARSTEPDDLTPLTARGGAAFCYPWQNCGEWILLLNAVESRFGDEADCTLRPLIRLMCGMD